MNESYIKLFSRLLNSSIWDEDDGTRAIWITLLVMADADGMIVSTVSSVARNSRKTVPSTEAALEKFMAPDPATLTAEFEGRRLEKVEGGWRLLNHGKYRQLLSLEERREFWRKRQSEYRLRRMKAAKTMAMRRVMNENLEAQQAAEQELGDADDAAGPPVPPTQDAADADLERMGL